MEQVQEQEQSPGWSAEYRVTWRYAWLPTRIDGRWRWRIGYYALQVMYDEESPPAFWITVGRSASPTVLLAARSRRHTARPQCVS